jgi:hypothetical protein
VGECFFMWVYRLLVQHIHEEKRQGFLVNTMVLVTFPIHQPSIHPSMLSHWTPAPSPQSVGPETYVYIYEQPPTLLTSPLNVEAACTSKKLVALQKPTQCKDSRGNVVNALKELGKIKLRFWWKSIFWGP